jgi:uncharacterized protein (DUF427 family)
MKYTVKERTGGSIIAQGTDNESVRLFEGNLYFAPDAVNMEHLRVTERIYTCPYKGQCFWIDLETDSGRATNVAWVYRNPKAGYEFIRDKIGFYNRDTAGTVTVKESVAATA